MNEEPKPWSLLSWATSCRVCHRVCQSAVALSASLVRCIKTAAVRTRYVRESFSCVRLKHASQCAVARRLCLGESIGRVPRQHTVFLGFLSRIFSSGTFKGFFFFFLDGWGGRPFRGAWRDRAIDVLWIIGAQIHKGLSSLRVATSSAPKYDGCGLRILGTVDTIHWFIPSGASRPSTPARSPCSATTHESHIS